MCCVWVLVGVGRDVRGYLGLGVLTLVIESAGERTIGPSSERFMKDFGTAKRVL